MLFCHHAKSEAAICDDLKDLTVTSILDSQGRFTEL